MGIVAQLLNLTPQGIPNPIDDYWYTPLGPPSGTGLRVTPDTAMRASAVWACVRLIAESLASLPIIVYRRTATGRQRAVAHPLWEVLHHQPNRHQTAFEFVEMLTSHALLRGNAYARIMPGPLGPVDSLVPIHPDRVRVEGLPGGGLRYQVRQADDVEQPVNDEDMFHLRGLSFDGVRGVSPIEYARESIGLSLATEGYGARFFGNGSNPRGLLKMPGKLSAEAAQRLKREWEAAHSGLGNAHRVAVLEEGAEWQQISIAPEDSQFLQTREFQIGDIARWFRVPPHMVGDLTKSTTWGTGIEQMSLGFVTYTLLPWMRRWESAIRRDLLLQPQTFFSEFLVDGLLRGDVKSRYDAYAVARQWGWLSVNDVRRLENMDPIGPDGDHYLEPLNMQEVGELAEPAEQPAQLPPALPAGDRAGDRAAGLAAGLSGEHYRLLVRDGAARILRKEICAMSRAAQRCAGDPDGWRRTVVEFYAEHALHVSQTLRIPRRAAERYGLEQQTALLADGAGAMADWETRRVADLETLALEAHDA